MCCCQRVMLLNDELARRAEEAGLQQTAKVAGSAWRNPTLESTQSRSSVNSLLLCAGF
jgi:hypothetical protein